MTLSKDNMTNIEVVMNGVSYPCRPTMGAMVRFNEIAGKDITQIKNDFTDMCKYLYCCVVSASAADGIPFDLDFMTFADALNPDDLSNWLNNLQEEIKAGTEA